MSRDLPHRGGFEWLRKRDSACTRRNRVAEDRITKKYAACSGSSRTPRGARREKLRGKIEKELKVHTQIEEEIFYPAYRDAARKKEDKKLYFEALEEHHVVDLVLPEMNDGASPEELKAKAKVLKELVEHHADEEEKEMFPRARKMIDKRRAPRPRRADAAAQRGR